MSALRLTVIALVAMLLTAGTHAQPINLRPKFEKGDQVRYRMVLDSTSLIRMGADTDQQKQQMKQEIRFLLRVVEAPAEKDATVELVYEALKIKVTSPMGDGEFDSDKPRDQDAGNMLAPTLRPVVGTVLTLTVDPDGNIKSVTGGEGILNAGIAAQLGQASGVRQLFGGIITPKRAPGAVKVGESWENVDLIDSGMMGSFKMTTKHTLKSATASAAELTFAGRIEMGSEAPASGFKINSSKYDGQYTWDLTHGRLEQMKSAQSVKMEGDSGGMSLSMDSDATMTVTRIN